MQLELRLAHERLSHLQHLHASNLEAMQRQQAEVQQGAAQLRELRQQLQLAQARVASSSSELAAP